MNDFTPEQITYLKWIRDTMPVYFADVIQPHLNNTALGGIGSVAGIGDFDDILSSITGTISSLGQSYSQYASNEAALQQRTNQIIATTRASSTTGMLPYILGGGALLVVLFFATRK